MHFNSASAESVLLISSKNVVGNHKKQYIVLVLVVRFY